MAAVLKQIVVALVLCACWTGAASAQKLGKFEGDLVLKRLRSHERVMQLAKPFKYIDSRGIKWEVPAGTRVDGASIPRALWPLVGSPFTGRYVEASVIHDHYCETRSRHWKAVHKVFLDGMLARGVSGFTARLMYIGVYRFGPRWDFDVDACYCRGCPACGNPILKRVKSYKPRFNQEDFKDLQSKLKAGLYSLEELEDAADYQLNTEILRAR